MKSTFFLSLKRSKLSHPVFKLRWITDWFMHWQREYLKMEGSEVEVVPSDHPLGIGEKSCTALREMRAYDGRCWEYVDDAGDCTANVTDLEEYEQALAEGKTAEWWTAVYEAALGDKNANN